MVEELPPWLCNLYFSYARSSAHTEPRDRQDIVTVTLQCSEDERSGRLNEGAERCEFRAQVL